MKRIVMICGLISGVLVSIFMVASIAWCYSSGTFEGNMLVGYASMLLSFSLIFVGVKNFRDKYNNGIVSFGKAFQIGLYISLIASSMYVVVWAIDYHFFLSDFIEKFSDSSIRKLKAEGATAAELEQKMVEMNGYKDWYKNPLLFALLTYMEILPVGLIVSLICALILKKGTPQVA